MKDAAYRFFSPFRDPQPRLTTSVFRLALFLVHRWEESLAQAYHTHELDPTHPWSFRTVGQSLDAMGRREEAIEAYLRPARWPLLIWGGYALVGRRSAARELLTALTRRGCRP